LEEKLTAMGANIKRVKFDTAPAEDTSPTMDEIKV